MNLGLSAYDLNIETADGGVEGADGGPFSGVERWRVVDVVGEVDLYVAARLAAYLGEQIDHQVASVAASSSPSGTTTNTPAGSPTGERSEPRGAGPLAGRARGVVVDLTGVDFIDSAGLGVLVGAFKRARAAGLAMPLVSANDSLRRLLSITALDRVLPVHDDVEQAARGR